ncbi:acidic mammalian chitinase-like [Wyeomyia smithii]|uniref:acidic mammalian chitinase-like n=1 Tax=Wyeomyia smithii TaxID=174621 RepID=UPI002467BFA9|nr:acidic mammalian chitinase-like [Wyeomyia smithii]
MVYQYISFTSIGLIETLDLNTAELGQFVKLKSTSISNPKMLISLGGPSQSSKAMSKLFVSTSQRAITAAAVLKFLNLYGLDGVDLHWQWPVLKGGYPDDRTAFPKLLNEMQKVLKPEGKLLTISVAPTKDYFASSYDVTAINPYVDYINVMAFDLRAYWNAQTGHSAAVYRAVDETGRVERELNMDFIIAGWIATGISPAKIILGVSANGHSFKLADSTVNALRSRTVGPGPAQKYTLEKGTLSYLEACELAREGGWTTVWDTRALAYYTYKGTTWLSYESQASLEAKLNLARENSIGGVGMWNVEGDDVRNVCGGGKYTLLSYIAEALISGSDSTVTPIAPTVTTTTTTAKTTTTTQATTGYPEYCPSSGFVRDPYDCQSFYRCTPGSKFVATGKTTCGVGTLFDARYNVCNHAASVTC